MLSVRQPDENQNVSQAPTLGGFGGVVTGQTGGQRGRGAVSGRGSGFTNLQSYIKANESNPNAQLIQQRTGQAGARQTEALKGFESQAGQARGQLENIQSQAGIVSSALQDPTKFVATPQNVQRITALRTGQEAIANPTEIQQNVLQGAQGLQSQRGMIGQELQRDVTGAGLQEYLRSQRVNPALATAGENRLDRFLAEQTASGREAIGGAMTEAQRIAALNQPEQVGQIGELVSQVQANPLATREGILNAISAKQQEEEKGLLGLNKEFVQQKIGLSDLTGAQRLRTIVQNRQENINLIKDAINADQNEINKLNNAINYENSVIQNDSKTPIEKSQAQFNIDRYNNQKAQREQSLNKRSENLIQVQNEVNQFLQSAQPQIDLLNTYEAQIQRPREQILQTYDPTTLARLRALEQITGSSFQDLLGGRII